MRKKEKSTSKGLLLLSFESDPLPNSQDSSEPSQMPKDGNTNDSVFVTI